VEDWNWKTTFYGHFTENHCDIIGQQSNRIRWKTQNKGYYTVQGHSRSLRSVSGSEILQEKVYETGIIDLEPSMTQLSNCHDPVGLLRFQSLFQFIRISEVQSVSYHYPVITQYLSNFCLWLTHSFSVISLNGIIQYMTSVIYCQKLDSLGHIFVADTMTLSTFNHTDVLRFKI